MEVCCLLGLFWAMVVGGLSTFLSGAPRSDEDACKYF